MISAILVNGVPIECINHAAVAYHVPAVIITSVLKIENGKVGKATPNKNGTFDYGPMQINTVWLDKLKKYGYTKDEILNNACTNVWVGAWILSGKIGSNKDFWYGLGSYNSGHLVQNYRYQEKVAKVYYNLITHG